MEAGETIRAVITSRHYVEPAVFGGIVSVERLSAISVDGRGTIPVEVVNLNAAGHYLHFQASPAATWILPHMLGRYPNVTTVDSLGREIEGEITYLDPNTVRADFEVAVGGSAFLS